MGASFLKSAFHSTSSHLDASSRTIVRWEGLQDAARRIASSGSSLGPSHESLSRSNVSIGLVNFQL